MAKHADWSLRALADLTAIETYYAVTASTETARLARDAIFSSVGRLCTLPATYKDGKPGTRLYVMRRFPYTIIYRDSGNRVRVVRVLHQARRYFNK